MANSETLKLQWRDVSQEELADLLPFLTEEEADEVRALLKMLGGHSESYVQWVVDNFPEAASKPFAPRHVRLGEWFDKLEPGIKPLPKIEAWGRGGAKSSSAEFGCVLAGVKKTRRFALYVSATQDQADAHVQSIAALFEKMKIDRAVTRYGQARGWRRNQLQTAGGFNVAAYGLDVATRGVKIQHYRPDLIILDDIDSESDSLKMVEKKIRALTSAVIPTGSADCAILVVQNLIYEDSIVSQIIDGRAEFLLDREPDCIEPAVVGLEVEKVIKPDGGHKYRIISGEATWAGQDIPTCEAQINEWGLRTFRREAQHEIHGADGHFFDETAFRFCDPSEVPSDLILCRGWDFAATQGGGDFTAGVLLGKSRSTGLYYVLDLKHHQFGSDLVRKLVKTTAERDMYGVIFHPDEYTQRGTLIEAGTEHYQFLGRVTLRMSQDPGGAGKDQAEQYKAILDEIGAKPIIRTVSGSKGVRARGFADAVNSGNVILVRAPWNHVFKEECRKFKEDETHDYDDIVDAGSDAYNQISKRAVIATSGTRTTLSERAFNMQNNSQSTAPPTPAPNAASPVNCRPGYFVPPAEVAKRRVF